MATPFYAAYLASMATTAQQEWQQNYQAASDDTWDNTATVQTIQAQTAAGAKTYENESVQVTSVVDPTTGNIMGNHFRKLVHKTYTTATNYVGKMYQFENKTWLCKNTNTRIGSVKTSILQWCNKILKWVKSITKFDYIKCCRYVNSSLTQKCV